MFLLVVGLMPRYLQEKRRSYALTIAHLFSIFGTNGIYTFPRRIHSSNCTQRRQLSFRSCAIREFRIDWSWIREAVLFLDKLAMVHPIVPMSVCSSLSVTSLRTEHRISVYTLMRERIAVLFANIGYE